MTIRREMIEQLRQESYDLLENSILENSDPDEPAPELNELELLARQSGGWRPPPDPQPPPRRPSTTATVRADWNTYVDERADGRLVAAFTRGGPLYEMLIEGIGDALGEVRERHRRALAVEVKALRRELADARAQIEALQTHANRITSWSIDRKNYRATPFVGSTPGPTLDLRQLFEQYRFETSD